jgi:aspartate ammonia-lyase
MSEGEFRIEKDLLGSLPIPKDALWGIHSARARENFRLSGRPVHPALLHAFGDVKLAAARVNRRLCAWDGALADAIEKACEELRAGALDQHLVLDAVQGGAGTSTNMAVNEVLANRALQILGRPLGDYQFIHPLNHINLHQSTNDCYPTALRIAAIRQLRELERSVVELMEAFQEKELAFADVVKVGRTQMQDAVLVTLGREMGAYAEALGRDRWRLYKCEERLRVVNLGGTAVGTGLAAPRAYIFEVVDELRALCGIGVARAENLIEATQNADAFAEVMGLVKTLAVNLMKIAGDVRLLGSGPDAGFGELRLPPRQAGSSIMPGKVNPVIPESVCQCAMNVLASDNAVSLACASGSLELNPFLPVVADHLLGSVDLLSRACVMFARHCVKGLEADREKCRRSVEGATALATALVDRLGYEKAQELASKAARTGTSVATLVLQEGLLSREDLEASISPEAVMRLGSR